MSRKDISYEQNAETAFGNIDNNFKELYEREGGGGSDLSSLHTNPVNGYNIDGNPIGGNVDSNQFGLGDMVSLLNGVILQREILQSKVKLPTTFVDDGTTKETYAHGSNFVIVGTKAYVTCFFNTRSGVDEFEYNASGDMRIAMFVFNLSTWEIEQVIDNGSQKNFFEVMKHGDAVSNGKYIASGAGDPIIFEKNGVITIAATCRLGNTADDSNTGSSHLDQYYMVYRDYTISSGVWGDITPCQFKSSPSATAVDMTAANFKTAVGATGWSNWFNMFAQYAEYTPTYKDANNQTQTLPTEYYVCVASDTSLANGVIVRTQDFHTFTYWITPVWSDHNPINLKYEMALATINTAWGKCLRVAARTANEKEMFVGTIDFDTYNSDGTVAVQGSARIDTPNPNKTWRIIPDGGSRPCFFPEMTNVLYTYLFHMTDIGSRARRWNSVEYVNNHTMVASQLSRVASLTEMSYPCVKLTTLSGVDNYIVTYTCQSRVYIGKFSKLKKLGDFLPMFAKFVDTFGPSQE